MRARLVSALSIAILSLPATAQDTATAPVNYTFRTAGIHMDGVKSLAELRGRPVFVEFWGRR
jgi:hypothetical protein